MEDLRPRQRSHLLAPAMPLTRAARKRESDVGSDEESRAPKRFKPSPADHPLATVATLVAGLLEDIEKIPPSLVVEGFARVLKRLLDETDIVPPSFIQLALQGISLQIDSLTAAAVETEYTFLVAVMIACLNELKQNLHAAREQAAMPPPPPVMPVPSSFATVSEWSNAQDTPNAILCLRPFKRQGLPLVTLHDAFRHFVNQSKQPLPTTEVAALKAAVRLCNEMAEPCKTEIIRRDAFNKALDPFIPKDHWLPEITMTGGPGMSGRIDGALYGTGSYPLLREDKPELGVQGDPYMQLSRGFQAFVMWKDMPSAAKFLLTLAGPTLMISGGFYDGTSTIVEPLTANMLMLPDRTQGRPMEIAQCLFALKNAIELIDHDLPPVVAATPRIYTSVLFDNAVIPISFIRPLPKLGSLMFLATATVRNVEEECLVKLVCGSYGTKVHRLLADADLAPRLLGTQTLEGAPTAIAMEYLQPYSPGSEGWATLFSLANDMEPDVRRSVVLEMVGIIKKLEEANLVHGDLRLNNVMVHVNADGSIGKAHIKIIDFDWSGESGTVTYPIWRNDQILNWPAGIGEAIVTDHDHTWVKQWWEETFPNEVYPPVG